MGKRIALLAWVTMASLVVGAGLFWTFESGRNPNVRTPFDVLWWWVVTSGTVGYGDIVPSTWQGRVVAIFTIVTGFFVFAHTMALIAESAHAFLERRTRGTAQVRCTDHTVICEYTAMADEFIQSISRCDRLSGREVAIVSDLVSRNPYPRHHFVLGVPLNPAALRMANVERARYVFVFANLRFADPDVKTMHVAARVLRMNPGATVFVEMTDPASDLAQCMPGRIVPLDSRQMVRDVLRGDGLDPSAWFGALGGGGAGPERREEPRAAASHVV